MRQVVYLLPLIVAGCASQPSSLVPLTGDGETVLTDRVVGEWHLNSAKPKTTRRPTISFGSLDGVVATISSESGSRFTMTVRREDAAISFTCTLIKIGDSLYVDLQHPRIRDAAIAGTTLRPHFFTLCTFVDQQIRLTACDSSRFRQVLEADGLPFVDSDNQLVFTGTSEQLQHVIREHSAELFRTGTGDLILTSQRPSESDN
ncbi:hypothetical protein [Fuerstiella marisgermanici]|uniref:Uncharacterized protein n=1 Tax=Fuerstiella marisgermanici TaxID=1891926 RepID=A0A1P8WJ27_9PLAN|nr:hypothetical protein [Fuerstiella marisgermanici]APZ94037.1 hypothetical protein Fuma_03658 [Fuerstiella marisgermanici]